MLEIRRILFPTDYSACAERALSHAAFLAERHGAELHVLHVTETGYEGARPAPAPLRITAADVAADLGLPAPDEPADPVRVVEAEVEAPEAAPAVLRYAQEHDVDLVVMGTHGRRGFRRLMLGSVAEEVVRLAPCPVLTVPEAAPEGAPAVPLVLAAVDFSDPSERAALHARALADVYGAELELLHVIDAAKLPAPYAPLMGEIRVERKEQEVRAKDALRELGHRAGADRTSVRVGHPPSVIVDEAARAGLLVMGSHGLTGLEGFLLGGVAAQVVRMAPCPVLTVRAFARSLLPARAAVTSAEA